MPQTTLWIDFWFVYFFLFSPNFILRKVDEVLRFLAVAVVTGMSTAVK